jgi:acrylyl-CoA reductase (NADPH)
LHFQLQLRSTFFGDKVTLANACASTRHGCTVAACGLAQDVDFSASVAPFILRAVALIGVDSVMATQALREQAWSRLATDLDRTKLALIAHCGSLAEALDIAPQILAGSVRSRLTCGAPGAPGATGATGT